MLEEVDWQTAAFFYMDTLSHAMEDWKDHKVFPLQDMTHSYSSLLDFASFAVGGYVNVVQIPLHGLPLLTPSPSPQMLQI